MMTDVAERDGPGLSSILAAGLTLIVAMLIATAFWNLESEQEDAIAKQRQLLSLYRGEIASRPGLEIQLARLLRRQSGNTKLLPGASTAISSAAIQDIVKSVVTRHGGQILSIQELSPVQQGRLEKIAVEVEFTVPQGGLKGVAVDLETVTPFLFIDTAVLRVAESGPSGVAALSNIRLHCTLHGYRRRGGL